MRRVGLMNVYGESAPNDYLIEAYGISAGHVARAAREVIGADASLASHRAAGA